MVMTVINIKNSQVSYCDSWCCTSEVYFQISDYKELISNRVSHSVYFYIGVVKWILIFKMKIYCHEGDKRQIK